MIAPINFSLCKLNSLWPKVFTMVHINGTKITETEAMQMLQRRFDWGQKSFINKTLNNKTSSSVTTVAGQEGCEL